MSPMRTTDTVVAVATARGRAGVAIIRISGRQARFVFETITGSPALPRIVQLRHLRDPATDMVIDRALTLYFSGPSSFTGEDVCEFHIHGSPAVSAKLLFVILDLGADIRLAEPGEFTRRAFENGRMNLVEVEALADLIDSETEWQRRQAMAQLDGGLGRAAAVWREMLIEASAQIEADLDFSDEADVGDGASQRARDISCHVEGLIVSALKSSRSGERVRDGFTVVILGPPNVGKSSLVNCIAGRDVAIVSDQAGTTRDLIEVACDLDGMPVIFVDTAGIRENAGLVEREGIRRALERSKRADCILALTSHDLVSGDSADIQLPTDIPVIRVSMKADEAGHVSEEGLLAVSTLTGQGIDHLMNRVVEVLGHQSSPEPALVTRKRHVEALSYARSALERASIGEQGELVAEDIRIAMRALERLIGSVDVDDVLDQLFSSFCIGK
jgi:tRNA modification GTPase